MKYLFFPIDIGIAHISRSLTLAEELQSAGHDVSIAIPKVRHPLYSKTSVRLIDIAPLSKTMDLRSMEYLLDVKKIEKFIAVEREILRKYKPDRSIVDFRFSALVSSIFEGVKTINLTGSGGLPGSVHIPNPNLHPLIFKLSRPSIKALVSRMMDKFYTCLEKASMNMGKKIDLHTYFRNVAHIVPEIPGYLEPVNEKLKRYYVGNLRWKGFTNVYPSWWNEIHPDGKTIYLSFGGTGYDKEKLIQLAHLLTNNGFRVVVTSSHIADTGEFHKNKNLFVAKFLPGDEISQKVDLVLCHGGYGTIMDAAMAYKPSLSIPFNPDQLLHALRFRELHLGEVLTHIRLKDYFSLTQANWNRFGEIGRSVTNGEVLNAVKKMLTDISLYKDSLVSFSISNNQFTQQLNINKVMNSIKY